MKTTKKTKVALLFIAAVLFLFFVTIGKIFVGNILSGRVHFPKQYVGEKLTMADGQKFTVFRRLRVDGKGDNPDSLAVFKVKFRFKNLSIRANKRLSIIPAPFLMGMKGFREKNWTIDESTNEFQGIYQWSSKEIAERYPDTFIFKIMTQRSTPGTVSYEIIPNTELFQYLSTN